MGELAKKFDYFSILLTDSSLWATDNYRNNEFLLAV